MQNVQIPITILSIIISVFIALISYVYVSDKKANTDRFNKFDKAIDKLHEILDGIKDEYQKLNTHGIENYASITNINNNCMNHRNQIKEDMANVVKELKDIKKRIEDNTVDITLLNAEYKIRKK